MLERDGSEQLQCVCGETATVLLNGRFLCSKHALATLTVPPNVAGWPLEPRDEPEDERVHD